MAVNSIDASLLKRMFLAGAKNLEVQKEVINELNVFPVPDGDTGTNMTLTILSAVKEIGQITDLNMQTLAKAISSGSLKGARGNSGVILSQLFRGFCKGVNGYDRLTVPLAAEAFDKAVDTAYKAVMKPKEGTILTVARAGAEAAAEIADYTDDVEDFLDKVIERMQQALDNTPELLPVLKEAGVVDSGGTGLLAVMTGARKGLRGEEVDLNALVSGGTKPAEKKGGAGSNDISTADIRFGYCTEFILQLNRKDEFQLAAFKEYLNSVGNSVVAFQNDHIVKVHVHTFLPEDVLRAAHRYGEFLSLKIENMTVMHSESVVENEFEIPTQRCRYALLAVACGEGIKQMLASGGCKVVDGGKSMNPSAQDILQGIKEANAETVFVFPNHKNVFLSAAQAKEICDFCDVVIVRSEDVGQCYHAIASFDDALSPEELTARFSSALDLGKTVQVAKAIRSCTEDGVTVETDDWICFDRDRILCADRDEDRAVLKCFESIPDAMDAVIMLFGEGQAEEDASALKNELENLYPDTEFILLSGGQPTYHYTFIIQ